MVAMRSLLHAFRVLPRLACLLAGLLCMGIFSGTAFADSSLPGEQQARTLRVAYMEFPPVTFRNEFGLPEGPIIRITEKVAQEAGYKLEFLYLPVGRTYLYLKTGSVDLALGFSGVPVLSSVVLESEINLISMILSAWYLEGTTPVNHMDDFRGKTLILINGFTYGGFREWLEQQGDIRITEAPNRRSAIDMLKRGRGHYLLDYHQPVREVFSRSSDSLIRESEIRTRRGAWLFSRATPEAQQLKEAFDAAYLRLAERGEVQPEITAEPGYILPGFPSL